MRAIPVLLLLAATAPADGWRSEVNHAIDRGIHRLLTLQRENGSFEGGRSKDFPMGVSSLAVYALVKSGLPADDPAVLHALEYLVTLELKKTYSVATYIMALDALGDAAYAPRIRAAAQWLEKNLDPRFNLWGYPDGTPELSNTQFAVMGLWLAEKHGYKVKSRTWHRILRATLARQNRDGGFGYRPDMRPESAGSMVTAGITVLFCASERLKGKTAAASAARGLKRAWAYMDRVFTAIGNPARPTGINRDQAGDHGIAYWHYYYLYGLERIAAYAQRKTIGGRDWYREGALYLLRLEKDGSWGAMWHTCFALLFLRRATFTGLTGTATRSGAAAPVFWDYTEKEPPVGWNEPGFEPAGWSRAAAAFGTRDAGNGAIRTAWKAKDIWIRREFAWAKKPEELRIFVLHDDDAVVWINGKEAAILAGFSQGKFVEVEIYDEARRSLVQGSNVLAARCTNIGGAAALDVRLVDLGHRTTRADEDDAAKHRRWWKEGARPDVPFVSRWLVLGPIPDKTRAGFLKSLLPDERAAPKPRETIGRGTWREVAAAGGYVDLRKLRRAKDYSLYYCFTWLEVAKDVDAVLRFGSDDGCRVLLDGKVLYSNHGPSKAMPDHYAHPVFLKKGHHRLLVKVGDIKGAAGLYLRVTRTDGTPAPEVRPVLSKDAPDWGKVALAHPALFTYAELLRLLPVGKQTKWPVPPGQVDEKGKIELLADARVVCKVKISKKPARPRAPHVRLSLFDGKLHSLETEPLERWAGREVLLIAENNTGTTVVLDAKWADQ